GSGSRSCASGRNANPTTAWPPTTQFPLADHGPPGICCHGLGRRLTNRPSASKNEIRPEAPSATQRSESPRNPTSHGSRNRPGPAAPRAHRRDQPAFGTEENPAPLAPIHDGELPRRRRRSTPSAGQHDSALLRCAAHRPDQPDRRRSRRHRRSSTLRAELRRLTRLDRAENDAEEYADRRAVRETPTGPEMRTVRHETPP